MSEDTPVRKPVTAPRRDWLSQDGARELAQRIEAYWEGRVRCRVEVVPVRAGTLCAVRSNMIGALPR